MVVILIFALGNVFAQFVDDFSDGDFSSGPTWTSSNASGAGGDFQITNDELQNKGPAATANLWISTSPVPALNTGEITWSFKVRYAAAPSGSNNVEIYLASDRNDLSDDPQGYFIRMGEGGSGDGIDLFKSGSSTPLISDPSPSVAAGIDVSIRVTCDASGNWTLEADDTGGSSFKLIGGAQDLTFTSGPFFGIKVNHTSTRNESFYFDDILVTHQDNSAPALLDIVVLSETELSLTFSEDLEPATAEAAGNYAINNSIGSPEMATQDMLNHRIVHLTFSEAFTNGLMHELTVSGIRDLAGNSISVASMTFLYFQEEEAMLNDILINEIFADPDPPNDLPPVEFVELHNNSNKIFDLSGWSFSDQSSTGELGSFLLRSGEFLILCDAAHVESFEPFGNVLGLPNWPTLNNAGDLLALRDKRGKTINVVQYSSNWYKDAEKSGGGWSLELINLSNTCDESHNWTASTDKKGGTPGAINATHDQTADNKPPELLSATALDEVSIKLTVNEPLQAAASMGTFIIDGNISVLSVELLDDLTTLILTLKSSIKMNTWYTIKVDNIKDCNGNILTDGTADFILVDDVTVDPKDVVINEIFPIANDEGNLPEAEFVELFNNSNKILNMDGWTFSDAATTGDITELILFPGDHAILCKVEDAAQYESFGTVAGLTSWPGLNNSGDNIVLEDRQGLVVDAVSYGRDWYNSSSKATGGWALELIDPGNSCSDKSNWAASEDASGGTPGRENSVRRNNPDLTAPALLEVLGFKPAHISARFNEILDPESARAAHYRIEPGVDILHAAIDDNLKEVQLTLANALKPATDYTLTVDALADCSGNLIRDFNTATFHLLEPADSADIIINEVLFNPRSGGVDFVEVYNRSAKFINLKDWHLANADNDGQPDQIRIVTEDDVILQPSQFLAVTADAVILKEQYPFSKEENFLEAPALPGYANDQGTVILLAADLVHIDQFNYTEDYHFDLLIDEDGVSLERVSFNEATNNAANWKSAASTVGSATPGYMNSQSRTAVKAVAGEITTDPKIIIPDGSGQNNFTTISYVFSQAGFVANAKIVDIYGRTIKVLSENDYLPAEGFYTWDATDDNGRKVRIGYYIVYFEVFDLDGEVLNFKEKVVVGTRF